MFIKKDEIKKIELLMVKGPGLPVLEADREGLHPARVLWSSLAVQNTGVQVGRFWYLCDFAAGRVLSFDMPGSKSIMLNWKNLIEV